MNIKMDYNLPATVLKSFEHYSKNNITLTPILKLSDLNTDAAYSYVPLIYKHKDNQKRLIEIIKIVYSQIESTLEHIDSFIVERSNYKPEFNYDEIYVEIIDDGRLITYLAIPIKTHKDAFYMGQNIMQAGMYSHSWHYDTLDNSFVFVELNIEIDDEYTYRSDWLPSHNRY